VGLLALIALVSLPSVLLAADQPRDSRAIETRVQELTKDATGARLLDAPLSEVRRTLVRIRDARAANDAAHATELTALADDWLAVAEDMQRAVALEQERAKLDRRVLELRETISRSELLLEETVAGRERIRQQLEQNRGLLAPKTTDGGTP
jgi:hypothetical protein